MGKHIGVKTLVPLVLVGILILVLTLSSGKLISFSPKAAAVKANLVVDAKKYIGLMPKNWKDLAQGGEESGVRMFDAVVGDVRLLAPRYIRIDHMYDFYEVVSRNSAGAVQFDWSKLDMTVCDIYRTGARPYFSLGYMPPTMAADGSLIGVPKDWNEWSLLVQKTVERYSGKNTRLCGGIYGDWLKDIYYEVWNEPDLEGFGKWNIYGGKDYKLLYFYSSQGATRAAEVNNFFLGGPTTTRPYASWLQGLLRYVNQQNLRLDFISWHHYSKNPDDFSQDVINVDSWMRGAEFARFRTLPKVISEWGYDSDVNSIADTNVGAAHTIAAIRSLIEQQVEHAFTFEVKDGLNPSWGVLTHDGVRKPRYYALLLLNKLSKYRLAVNGEGTYVKAIASTAPNVVSLVLVNYDTQQANTENVPFQVTNLDNGSYSVTTTDLLNDAVTEAVTVQNNQLSRNLIMPPNSVFSVEIERKEQ
ncbi:MAG: hypothetical protein WC775_05740 [Patescibacteria group bacterium]|jgi:hypothetical protein